MSLSNTEHLVKNIALTVLSLILLPLSTCILLASYAVRPIALSFEQLHRLRSPLERQNYYARPSPPQRTILVTGVGMTKGLTLARAFHIAGHRVIGADVAPYGVVPPCGRFSRALNKFYTLPAPTAQQGPDVYIHALLQIVHRERVDLWVSCSGVASALDDGRAVEVIERRSDCVCIQFSTTITQTLHEKDTFIAHTASLGLPVPETHNVTSRDAVHKVLHQSPRTKKQYIMKSVGMDDATRGDMTILPRRSLSQTYDHVAKIPISPTKPWVLQQYVPGKREYCTHALVVRGKVVVFLACPSSELLMHYEALPHPESALSRSMLRFTQEFVERSGAKDAEWAGMTGHLSFDFLVDEQTSEKGAMLTLQTIECNPRAHTAVVLFQGQEKEMVAAYLTAIDGRRSGHTVTSNGVNGHTENTTSSAFTPPIVTPRATASRYYWIGNDIVALGLYPLIQALVFRHMNLQTCRQDLHAFLDHIIFWKDGTYEPWDPLPAWWLYHVYWPGQFLGSLITGNRWSRMNVSTCKMFGC